MASQAAIVRGFAASASWLYWSRVVEAPQCGVTGTDQETRLAVAFYGAQRSTPLTLASIEKNLYAPLLEASDAAMDVFVHAMVVRNLDAVSRVKSEVTDPILNPSP